MRNGRLTLECVFAIGRSSARTACGGIMVAKQPTGVAPERKRRKRRDKDKPKRAMSAYLVFLNRHRDRVQKKSPNASVTDITKELALKWKTVSDAERAECQRVSDQDKERYYREMRDYVPLPDEKEDEPAPRYDKDGNRKRRKKDKAAPRKNRSAYIIWAQEYREKHFRPKAATPQAVTFREQAAILGSAWKALSASGKKKYEDIALQEAQAYAIKRDAYLAEKKALALAAREAKRQRLLDEKRAWEATKEAAAKLKQERKEAKAAEKAKDDGKPKGSLSKVVAKPKKDTAMLAKIREAVMSATQSENAYYAVLDMHEVEPEKVIAQYKANLEKRASPDGKTFLVNVLGFDNAAAYIKR